MAKAFIYKTPTDLRTNLVNRIKRNQSQWLSQLANDEPIDSVDFVLGVPTQIKAAEDLKALESWIKTWNDFKAPGAEVIFRSVNWPALGGERMVPERVRLTSLTAVLKTADTSGAIYRQWARARERLTTLQQLGLNRLAQAEAAAGYFVLQYSNEDFDRLVALTRWLLTHRPANCYVREIPVEGVHTKWLEKHRRVITFAVLSESDDLFISPAQFFQIWGFKEVPTTIRVRHAEAFISGLMPGLMIELPAEAMQQWQPRAVVIVENIQTGLSLSVPEDVLVFMGLGFGIEKLKNIAWLTEVPIIYFGDLDVHGLKILALLRSYFNHTRSILMDIETFARWQSLATEDPTNSLDRFVCPRELSAKEAQLYARLASERLRLEQERIPMSVVNEILEAFLAR